MLVTLGNIIFKRSGFWMSDFRSQLCLDSWSERGWKHIWIPFNMSVIQVILWITDHSANQLLFNIWIPAYLWLVNQANWNDFKLFFYFQIIFIARYNHFRFFDPTSEKRASVCFLSNLRFAADGPAFPVPGAPGVNFRFVWRPPPWPVTFFNALGTM